MYLYFCVDIFVVAFSALYNGSHWRNTRIYSRIKSTGIIISSVEITVNSSEEVGHKYVLFIKLISQYLKFHVTLNSHKQGLEFGRSLDSSSCKLLENVLCFERTPLFRWGFYKTKHIVLVFMWNTVKIFTESAGFVLWLNYNQHDSIWISSMLPCPTSSANFHL